MMTTHRWVGTGVVLWTLPLCILSSRQSAGDDSGGESVNRVLFRVLLWSGAVAVAFNGYLGGALVYGLDHLAW